MKTSPTPSRSASRPLRRTAGLALPALALALVAAGDPPAPPPPPPTPSPTAGIDDNLMIGARYFDQAIAYVARGGTLGRAVDLYAQLDVKWDLEDNHHEGTQTVWFQAPDRMRTELTAAGIKQTKILLGDRAWNVLPNGSVKRVHATPGAEAQLKQMKEDLVRVQDLTAFVTLEGLKGPGIVFEFQGATKGDGVYAGEWLKVARRAPDGRKMTFYVAYERTAEGGVRATFPGVVRIDGDAATGLWTEDWILSGWDTPRGQPRPYRYPARIQAWRTHPDPVQAQALGGPRRFLLAVVDDIRINAGISAEAFTPPATDDAGK